MAVLWERLAGDTSVFALKMGFSHDPDDGQRIDPEVGVSWGSFQIWVEGRNLCAHRELDGLIDSVHWYLLPLMEWFVSNWNPILHEERPPVQNRSDTGWESLHATRFPPPAIEDNDEKASAWESEWQQWWMRHSLGSAREGGLFPDVVFRRFRDSVEISWGPARSAGMPDHFNFLETTQGVSRITPEKVAEPLHNVLSNASDYLISLAPESSRIETLVSTLRNLKSVEESDRRVMWLAGLGTDRETVWNGWNQAKIILKGLGDAAHSVLSNPDASPIVVSGSCQAALMFGSLSPDIGREDILPLATTMVDLSSPDGEPETISRICHSITISTSDPPWRQGYDLAVDLHEYLGTDLVDKTSVDIEHIIKGLGIEVIPLELSDARVRGVAVAGPHHRPGIVINKTHDRNRDRHGSRFTLAHELCHVLFDRQEGRRLAMASGPWAPRHIEKRANAFAAMLLMPPPIIKRTISRISYAIDTHDGVRDAAHLLQAGVQSVLWHLRNTGFITDTDYEMIDDKMGGRGSSSER